MLPSAADDSPMADADVITGSRSFEDIEAEHLAAIAQLYEVAIAHIASLAEGGVVPVDQTDRRRGRDAATVEIAVQAA